MGLTTTVTDSVAMGQPAWAAIGNALVRHYYRKFIHADLPWPYGKLGSVFVSPAVHRWHDDIGRTVTEQLATSRQELVWLDRARQERAQRGRCARAGSMADRALGLVAYLAGAQDDRRNVRVGVAPERERWVGERLSLGN
jgi:hypothetical protein